MVTAGPRGHANPPRGSNNPMTLRKLATAALALAAASAFPAISLTVNVTEGQTISGSFQFDVRVQSEHLVTSVEFYIGDNLRATDESTPYQFKIDTLEEPQGDITVTFAAFNAEGPSTRRTLRLKIDNGFDKGVAHHVARSKELLANGKVDEAIEAARVALKINRDDNTARIAMARANFVKRTFDIAQKFAEDALAAEPDNADAKALLSAINLRRAFTTSGNNPGAVRTALRAAAESQARILETQASAAGELTGANLLPAVDANLRAHNYSEVIRALRPDFERNLRDTNYINRFLFALVRAGRFTEANKALNNIERFGAPDGYTFALRATILQFLGDRARSEAAEKEAILEAPNAPATKFAQAYLALARGNFQTLGALADDLERSDPQGPLTNYYQSVRFFLLREFEQADRHFQTALLADPANYDVMVERGNQIIESAISLGLQGNDLRDRVELAVAFFDSALAARPESFEALTGLSIAYNMQGRIDDAIRFAQAAVAAGEEYPAAHYALASALSSRFIANPRDITVRDQARAAAEAAGRLDPRLRGVAPPAPAVAWNYFWRSGRIPLLPMPRSN